MRTTLAALLVALSSPAYAVDISIDYGPPAAKTTVDARDYAACLAAVDRGETVYLAVGPYQDREITDYWIEKLPPMPNGRYRCWLDPVHGQRMEPADAPAVKVAPEVRPAPTFPQPVPGIGVQSSMSTGPRVTVKTGSAVAEHYCPKCRTGPWYTIMGWNPDDTHNHLCQNCGQVFSH